MNKNRGEEGSVLRRKNLGMDQNKNQKDSPLCEAGTTSCCKKKINGSRKEKRYSLCSFRELPDYMKDNEYILNYYRVDFPVKEAFFSMFRWHNETLNVWTHLVGFFVFVGLTVAHLVDVPQVADFITIFTGQFPSSAEANISKNFSLGLVKLLDLNQEQSLKMEISPLEMANTKWPFYVFLCGSMFCLLTSSICHLFCCHSHNVNLQLLHIDYVGISVMIITSFFPPVYYIFQCTPHWQITYLTGISLMGIFTIFALLSPALAAGKYRSLRALLFVSMGLFGLFPAIHALMLNWNDPHRDITLAYESVMALLYLTGAMFYVCRIPERWKPGWFDLAGHSHQIFHVFVVMGALAHYAAAQVFLKYRSSMACEV